MKLLLSLSLFAVSLGASAGNVVVVDSVDSVPLSGATVIAQTGMIAGITDGDGRIAVNEKDWPLTVRSLGYSSVTIDEKTDTLRLAPAAYALPEVVVSPGERPITRVICYAREYCSGATSTDTMQMYSEYMIECFGADGKVKGYKKGDSRPTTRNVRRYARRVNSEGLDSVARPRSGDDETFLSFMDCVVDVPMYAIEESEAIINGALADTVQGKYCPKFIYRKTDNLYLKTTDLLSDYKDHKWSPFLFKLFGLTMDINNANFSLAYKANNSGKYGIGDLVYGTYGISILGRGKWIKKMFRSKDSVDMDCYVEVYPVDIEYCTVEEYKEMRNDSYRIVEFQKPLNLQPLPPSVQALIDKVDTELPLLK